MTGTDISIDAQADGLDAASLSALDALVNRPRQLRDWLDTHLHTLIGPTIDTVTPTSGQRGTVLTIGGSNFSANRLDNSVTVGGYPAFVLTAAPDQLVVVTGADTDTGKVEVTVGANTATSAVEFVVTGYPAPGAGDDGPPVVVQGEGDGSTAGDVNPIGTIRVLVVMLQTTDIQPTTAASTRNTVTSAWNNVQTYYDQVSYTQTQVQFDVTTFGTLDGTFADFVDTGDADNYREDQLGRIAAFAAKTATDQGFHLDDYAMLCSVVFTNGTFVRAWGGASQSTFAYDNGLPVGDPNRISINLTANHEINTLFINESANWGRFAHEFGHNIVSAPSNSGDGTATLGEDIYGTDLVDPTAATAKLFDLMGKHDTHPIFSGYHLEKLGYYTGANITTLTWDRNPFNQTFDVIAHALTQDTTSRVHIVKIKVSDALSYYVEVRQRPGATSQVFDDSIPIGGSANQGGVIVTRAIAGEMHNNQQTRFISLMHDERVLVAGEFVEDPARALRITVVDDNVQSRPQVCRVRVEWAQTIADDPNGSFDLRIDPWDNTWQSPDVWVDRDPFGSFDSGMDADGRPLGNGDRPKVNAVNHFTSRVHVSGAMGASNVKLTFYAVTPPGVGDNGNWAPIAVRNIPSIAAGSFVDTFTNWVPTVGKHTCLKVYASAQLGEISGHNNSAQENVFDFQSAGASPCEPVLIRTAIRNPVAERRAVRVELHGVPQGWGAQLPHAWVVLDGLAERELDVAIWPTADFATYKIANRGAKGERGHLPGLAPLRINGQVPRDYDVTLQPDGSHTASRFYPIGGTFNRVAVRHKSSILLEKVFWDGEFGAFGIARPGVDKQRVVVALSDPAGRSVATLETSTDPGGAFRLTADLRTVAETSAPGTFSVQAFLFDADYLADAESNLVQISI